MAEPTTTYAVALAALPPRRRHFVALFLETLNATEAARRAGYRSPHPEGARLLQNATVRAAVDAGLDAFSMSKSEILARLTRIARGSIADVLRLPDPGSVSETGEGQAWALDLVKAQETGAIDLVRRIRQGEHGPEVEMYSAHDALRDLARVRGLLVERRELSGPGGGPIPVQAFEAVLAAAYGDVSESEPE